MGNQISQYSRNMPLPFLWRGAFWCVSFLMAKLGLMGGRAYLVMEEQMSWEDGDSHSVIAHSLVAKAGFWGQHQWKLGVRSVPPSCSPSWGLTLRPSSQSVGFCCCCCLRFALEVTEANRNSLTVNGTNAQLSQVNMLTDITRICRRCWDGGNHKLAWRSLWDQSLVWPSAHENWD